MAFCPVDNSQVTNTLKNWNTLNPEQKTAVETWAKSNSSSIAKNGDLSAQLSNVGINISPSSADVKLSDIGSDKSTKINNTFVEGTKIPVGQQLLPALPVGQRSWIVQESSCEGVVTTASLVDGNESWNFGLGLPFASIGGGSSQPESIETQKAERRLMKVKAYAATFGNIDRTAASQTTKSHVAKTAAIFGDESPEKVVAASEIQFTDGRSACQSVPPTGNTPPPTTTIITPPPSTPPLTPPGKSVPPLG